MSVDALMKQIEELPESERDELFERLDDRFGDPEAPIEVSNEVLQLLEERNAAYEADPTNLRTWEQLMESVRKQK